MKRTLLFETGRQVALVVAGTCLIAATYGLVRLAYGLFLPDIAAGIGLTPTAAGVISSAASIAYCVGALLGLSAGRRSRWLVGGATATAALGSLGMVLAPDVTTFAPAAVLSSMGAGLASPGLVAVVERNVGAPGTDRAQAVVNTGTGPGLVAAGVLALVLLPDWRLGFAVSAAATVAAGVAVLVLDRGGARVPATGRVAGPRRVERRPPPWARLLLAPAVAALLMGAGSAAMWTYGRTQLIAQGAGEVASTLAWVVLGVGGSAAVLTAGWLSRPHPARAWRLTAGVVAASIALLAVAGGRPGPALAACALFGWGFVAATSALITWAAHLVPDRAAAGTSVLFVTLVLGQALGSASLALAAELVGLSAAFGLAAVVALMGAAVGPAGSGESRRGVRSTSSPTTEGAQR